MPYFNICYLKNSAMRKIFNEIVLYIKGIMEPTIIECKAAYTLIFIYTVKYLIARS